MMQQQKKVVVLVVEDDALIRMTASDIFLSENYDVVEACNADDAVAILEKRLDIQVVFNDIEMPGVHGWTPLGYSDQRALVADQYHRRIRRVAVKKHELLEGSRFSPDPSSDQDVLVATREVMNPP